MSKTIQQFVTALGGPTVVPLQEAPIEVTANFTAEANKSYHVIGGAITATIDGFAAVAGDVFTFKVLTGTLTVLEITYPLGTTVTIRRAPGLTWETSAQYGGATPAAARAALGMGTPAELRTLAGAAPSDLELPEFSAQAGKILQPGTAPLIIAAIGDSWTYGDYWLGHVRDFLQAKLGNLGVGFVGIAANAALITSVTRTKSGVWADADGNAACIAKSTSSDTATPGAWQVVGTGTAFVLHYETTPGGGSFRWRINGGAWTTVSTDAALAHETVQIATGLAVSSHTIEIEVTVAGAAGVTLYGLDVQRSGTGSRVHNLGRTGSDTAAWLAPTASVWQAALASLTPDLVTVQLSVNDAQNSRTPAAYGANLETLVGRIRAAVPLADIVFVSQAAINVATTYPISEYTAVMEAKAAELGVGYIPNADLFGAYATANLRGMYADNLHLSLAGYRVLAENVAAHLVARFPILTGVLRSQTPITYNNAANSTVNALNLRNEQIGTAAAVTQTMSAGATGTARYTVTVYSSTFTGLPSVVRLDTDNVFNFWAGGVFSAQIGGAGFYTPVLTEATVAGAGSFRTLGGIHAAKKIITTTDFESGTNGGGIFLKSPDGTRYKLTVANGGTVSIAATP